MFRLRLIGRCIKIAYKHYKICVGARKMGTLTLYTKMLSKKKKWYVGLLPPEQGVIKHDN